MKLNTRTFRYLSPDDWRVLTAVEIGSKNHQVVPTALITQLSGLRTGSNGAEKCISTLAKADLVARVRNSKYDGYRLTYGGLDYLALHAHTKSASILHLGSQMGVGKESDIYLVMSPAAAPLSSSLDPVNDSPTAYLTSSTNPAARLPSTSNSTPKPVQSILKIHRLGRTSFRSLARNRDYHRHRQHCSWQYLSRLSAQKEYSAMCALYDAGFPVPRPIACNRHTIVMSLVPGVPMKDVPLSAFSPEAVEEGLTLDDEVERGDIAQRQDAPLQKEEKEQGEEDRTPESTQRDKSISALYDACMELSLRLASHGLIHGDLNEFNILIENVPDPSSLSSMQQAARAPMKPYLIDFPQITSLSHPDAVDYYARDVACIQSFFEKRYHFVAEDEGPTFADAQARLEEAVKTGTSRRLDVAIEAAGFSKKLTKELEGYFARERNGSGAGDGEDRASLDSRAEDGYEETYDGEFESLEDPNVDKDGVLDGLDVDRGGRDWSLARVGGQGSESMSVSTELLTEEINQNASPPRKSVLTGLHGGDVDSVTASKMNSLSLRSPQPPRATAKAVAGWSI